MGESKASERLAERQRRLRDERRAEARRRSTELFAAVCGVLSVVSVVWLAVHMAGSVNEMIYF